jgi:hypothetical protein
MEEIFTRKKSYYGELQIEKNSSRYIFQYLIIFIVIFIGIILKLN